MLHHRRWLPLAGAALLYAALTALFAALGMRGNGGAFSYALDDAYIHLAMVKHQLAHGVWGVTPYEWTSSSSSPLWGATLLALGALTGHLEYWPLALNVGASLGLLAALDAIMRSNEALRGPWLRLGALTLFTLAAPLPYLTLLGMEHVLQGLLVLTFAHVTVRHLGGEHTRWESGALLVLAALVTSIRFEGIAVVAAAALLLAWRRRWGLAFGVAALGALPVALYALVSLSHGWYALPNSVLAKRAPVSLGDPLSFIRGNWIIQLLRVPLLNFRLSAIILLAFPVVAAALMALNRRAGVRGAAQGALALLFLVAAAQAILARGGLRYEFYLVVLLAYALARQQWPRPGRLAGAWLRLAAAGVVAFLLLGRGLEALTESHLAMMNIHAHHGTMGRFLREHYPGASVAMTDIGYANYATDLRLLDLAALGTREVMAQRLAGVEHSPEGLQRLAATHGVEIAILYELNFTVRRGGEIVSLLPPGWVRVGEWTITTPNVVLTSPTLALYATSEAEAARLAAALRAVEPELPPTVRATFDR